MRASRPSHEKCDLFPPFRGACTKYYGGRKAKFAEGRGQKNEKGDLLMSRHIIGDSRCAHTAEQRGMISGKQPMNDDN
jgi:hypothetical protein